MVIIYSFWRNITNNFWRHFIFHLEHFSCNHLKISMVSLHEKPYFPSPGISWKAQKDQVNTIFPSTFWLKKRLFFPSPKSSKQELFSNQ